MAGTGGPQTIPEALPPGAVRVFGVGNPYRGDDAVGPRVAELLRERLPAAVAVAPHDGEVGALLEAWEDAELVVVADAVHAGEAPGTVVRLDAARDPLPPAPATSSHGFGVAETVELGRALGSLPPRLVVYGIEGADYATGAPLSPVAERAAAEAAGRIAAEIEAFARQWRQRDA